MTFRVGQVLRVCREHMTISSAGNIEGLYEGDLLLIVESVNSVQGRAVRMSDGTVVHITSLPIGFDVDGLPLAETYVELPMGEIDCAVKSQTMGS